MFDRILKDVSIKKRIFIASILAMFSLFVVSVYSVINLNKATNSFKKFEDLNAHILRVLKLDEMVSGLQRDIVSYTYTGRAGIQKRVLEQSTKILDIISLAKEQTSYSKEKELLERMEIHLANYLKTFETAVEEINLRRELIDNEISSSLKKLDTIFHFDPLKNKIQSLNLLVSKELFAYLYDPNYSSVLKSVNILNNYINKTTNKKKKDALVDVKEDFLRIIQATRGYLYLINVVMAGEAFEFKYVSTELSDFMRTETQKITKVLLEESSSTKQRLVLFCILFLVIAIILAWSIGKSITVPVTNITKTFQSLSQGNYAVDIGEVNRKDEIGVLAKAANTFKEKGIQLQETILELDDNKKKLEESNEELSQFAYRTSHDLRSPLGSIISITEIITEDIEDKKFDEVLNNLKKISIAAFKLETLISDILNLTKADHYDSDLETFSVREVFHSVLGNLEGLMHETNLSIDFESNGNDLIKTQKIRFHQVLENLVSNAIKYYDSNKKDPFIKVVYIVQDELVKVEVIDNGLGIPEEYIGELFGMFKRFHTKANFGSGLGLYLVKKHINKLSGSINVVSKVNEGSKFIIELPK